MKQSPIVIHPYLFAIFPALSIVADHVRFLSINRKILGMALITIMVAFLSNYLLTRAGIERRKAGIFVSLFLLLFFSYGHVYTLISDTFRGIDIRHRHLLFFWIILAIILVFLSTKASNILAPSTNFLNIMGACLVILSVIQIASYEISTRNVWKPARDLESTGETLESSEGLPDIYYIILDTYASSSTLREFYDFENNTFISFLQDRGFFVAEESFSNYAVTALSLASSLNMDYIDKLSPNFGDSVEDWQYAVPKQMIENNNVTWFLKSRGYTFIFLGSGHGVTQGNRYADRDIKCGFVDETIGRIIQSTLIWPAADQFQIMANDDRHQRLCAFEKLAEMPANNGPIFVFAHILAPHLPFLFDANGNPVREYEPDPVHIKEYYINQLIFINKKVEETVTEILSKSEVEPIIILQGDTGPPYGFETGAALQNPGEEIYKQNLRILNAYHLPQDGAKWLYTGISPVNTFRLIFNVYFGIDIPLLDNQSYFGTAEIPYRFIDVTESIDYH